MRFTTQSIEHAGFHEVLSGAIDRTMQQQISFSRSRPLARNDSMSMVQAERHIAELDVSDMLDDGWRPNYPGACQFYLWCSLINPHAPHRWLQQLTCKPACG
jgi:hypothetical protein